MDEYRAMQQAHVFPIPRAIAVYQGSLIASVTQMDGAHIIAYTPDADDFNADSSFKGIKDDVTLRNPEFTEIAEQSEELPNYPAYHMYDANYGGTVYQMIEYNDKLYMAINAGQKALHSTPAPDDVATDFYKVADSYGKCEVISPILPIIVKKSATAS